MAITVPTTEVTIAESGYYNFSVVVEWDTWTGGGSVTLIRNRAGVDVTVWPPSGYPTGLWSASDGSLFSGTSPAIPCQVGDVIRVNVDHGDGSAQTLASAFLSAELIDRVTETILDPLEVIDEATTRVTTSWGGSVNLPTLDGGDLALLIIGTRNTTGWSEPSGWTLEQSSGFSLRVYTKIATGSEGSTLSFGTPSGGNPSVACWVGALRAGWNWADYPIDCPAFVSGFNPPAVTPSHGANDYRIFAFMSENNRDNVVVPSGYTEVWLSDPAQSSGNVELDVADKDVTDDSTEDPGSFSSTGIGSGNSGTIAVLASL